MREKAGLFAMCYTFVVTRERMMITIPEQLRGFTMHQTPAPLNWNWKHMPTEPERPERRTTVTAPVPSLVQPPYRTLYKYHSLSFRF